MKVLTEGPLYELERFEPLILNVNLPYDELREKFTQSKTNN